MWLKHICAVICAPNLGVLFLRRKILTRIGGMAEWFMAHAWKACLRKRIQGSNPCLSAILLDN